MVHRVCLLFHSARKVRSTMHYVSGFLLIDGLVSIMLLALLAWLIISIGLTMTVRRHQMTLHAQAFAGATTIMEKLQAGDQSIAQEYLDKDISYSWYTEQSNSLLVGMESPKCVRLVVTATWSSRTGKKESLVFTSLRKSHA